MATTDLQAHSSHVPSQQGSRYQSDLADYELESNSRLPFLLSVPEVKLLGIAGVRPFSIGHTTITHVSFSRWGFSWMVRIPINNLQPSSYTRQTAYDLFIINVSRYSPLLIFPHSHTNITPSSLSQRCFNIGCTMDIRSQLAYRVS